MGAPCEPLTARQELISELEGLGYDRVAPADWRDVMSDAELAAAAAEQREACDAR